MRVVHYLNQFFGGLGGEERADVPLAAIEGAVGPGQLLEQLLDDDARVVVTLICGDNYAVERQAEMVAGALERIRQANADLFVAGPCFQAGRYGMAAGALCSEVQSKLSIPVITGLDEQEILDWYDTDREFRTWEVQNLRRLQTTLATELIRLGFMRNMALFIAKDANILGRSYDLDSLSRREFDYLKYVRKHYTPGDLLALEKVLNPNAHAEHVTINLSWGDAGGSSHHVIEGVKSEYQQLEAVDADSEPVFAG